MPYHSHSHKTHSADFSQALLANLAPDGGLWMPDNIPHFDSNQLINYAAMSFADCAAELAQYFTDTHFSSEELKTICRNAYNFDMPLQSPNGQRFDSAYVEPNNQFFLELFHGPTLAFKDFAARLMARMTHHIMQKTRQTRTILVATSGDTGGAIGEAFLNQAHISVYILFPKNGVSPLQARQLTTIGTPHKSNIRAIAVNGHFDDCQRLVKDAFSDSYLNQRHKLMSANSINIGRIIPQSFYYFWTSLQLKAAYPMRPIVYAIPSGNLGNLTGGLIAKKMGAPIHKFIIGNNVNRPFVDYLASGDYAPRPSVPTLSNAMDIGRPNNFQRILSLYNSNLEKIRKDCWGAAFSDSQTEAHMRTIFKRYNYQMCPHTAIGHLAMTEYAAQTSANMTQVTVATAHPAKFSENVTRILGQTVALPPSLQNIMHKTPQQYEITPDLTSLADILNANAH